MPARLSSFGDLLIKTVAKKMFEIVLLREGRWAGFAGMVFALSLGKGAKPNIERNVPRWGT